MVLELTDSSLANYPFIYLVEGGQVRIPDFGDGREHIGGPNYPVEMSLGGAVAMRINVLVHAQLNRAS